MKVPEKEDNPFYGRTIRKQFVDAAFRSVDSNQLYRKLSQLSELRGQKTTNPLDFFDAGDYLVDEDKLLALLPELLIDPKTNKLYRSISKRLSDLQRGTSPNEFPLALILSQVPFQSVDPSITLGIDPVFNTNADFSISPVHKGYLNCRASEYYLRTSLERDEVVSVYEGILVKGIGQHVGLCYSAVTNGKGTFLPGFWYGARSELFEQLEGAIKHGVQEISPNGE